MTGQMMALEREGFASSFAWERRIHRDVATAHGAPSGSHRKWSARAAGHELAFSSPELSLHRAARALAVTPLRVHRVRAHAVC